MKNYSITSFGDGWDLHCNGEFVENFTHRLEAHQCMSWRISKDKSERKAQLYEILSQDCSVEKKLEQVGNMLL